MKNINKNIINVGINGFGRIGRTITRLLAKNKKFRICKINDINNDISNLAYLLKYDTIYGKIDCKVSIEDNQLIINKNPVDIFSKKKIDQVNWGKVDLVIEATGSNVNLINSKKILSEKLKKIIITHSPKDHVDFTMIMGVNEHLYNFDKHNIISSSICDASALAPVLDQLEKNFGIENGYVTTLHSWLSYQNLLDGSVQSVASPGHNWKDYSLGRSSPASIITKKTTAISAVERCVPSLHNKISGLSFRVPTPIVCGSDLTINLKKKTSINKLKFFFKNIAKKNKKIFEFQEDSLVSIDHLKTSKSVVIDANYMDLNNSKLLKMVIWYDNEWGYSNRVMDIAELIVQNK